MESLYTDSVYLIANASWNIFWNTTLFSIYGFLIGLTFVIIAGKIGLFKRKFTFWGIIAKLNYLYIPVVFIFLGGFFGSAYGVHVTFDEWIDDSTQPIVDYGNSYVPEMQNFINNHLELKPGEQTTIGQLITKRIESQLDNVDKTSYSYEISVIFEYLLYFLVTSSIEGDRELSSYVFPFTNI